MRRARRRLALGLALAIVAACASPPPAAWLQVDLLSGGPPAPVLAPEAERRLQMILDLTPSMLATGGPGGEPTPLEAARSAAADLLRRLPSSTEVGLQVVGIASGVDCPPPVWFSTPMREHTPEQLATGIRPLAPRSEGSLREALVQAREAIERSEPASSWQVAIFSDLGAECGGAPCAEIQTLVDLGARVDLVLLGAEPPACLAEIEVPEDAALGEALAPPPPPSFRLEAVPGEDAGEAPVVWARGRAMQEPIRVPPGRAVVVLELEPPFRIGPVDLRRGVLTRVRGVDFPAAQPSWRAWSVGRRSAAGLPGGTP